MMHACAHMHTHMRVRAHTHTHIQALPCTQSTSFNSILIVFPLTAITQNELHKKYSTMKPKSNYIINMNPIKIYMQIIFMYAINIKTQGEISSSVDHVH